MVSGEFTVSAAQGLHMRPARAFSEKMRRFRAEVTLCYGGSLCNTFEPAVLRALERVIRSAKAAGITVGMCGEAAADADLIPKLIEWGLDFSRLLPSAFCKPKKPFAHVIKNSGFGTPNSL